ncbi:hypothetical protein C1H46_025173 [Malus baccata]|uniref:Glutamine amidotransferase type-2 domain-containing protein n=1 Tax=Malus baccata TaxID=106549 RepID=A0A540LS36_MALBA|nr:hypothetical protein C1H46_025173 [Malus baccata]
MCGIALIICGIRFHLSSLFLNSTLPVLNSDQLAFDIDDLREALRRRGPDRLGSTKLLLHSPILNRLPVREIVSSIEGEVKEESGCEGDEGNCFSLENGRTPHLHTHFSTIPCSSAELHFLGATLQLRGVSPVVQPLIDSAKNILVYNGEIFGGIDIGSDENDGEVLLQLLGECCLGSIPGVLSRIKGPWAIIYWQESAKTLWFARDAFGRRSLLVHWPTEEDSRLLLSSVSPVSSNEHSSDIEAENGTTKLNFWEELRCGIYSISMDAPDVDGVLVGEVKKHDWTNPVLEELIKWERTYVEPKPEDLHISHSKSLTGKHDTHLVNSDIVPIKSGSIQVSISVPAQAVLIALRESVMRRSSLHTVFQAGRLDMRKEIVPVAVLFSGGLDSMIIAALLHQCLDPSYDIDLLNVSFDGRSAPDRISARAGVNELRRIAPSRKWKLVEINAELSTLTFETKHVMSLINPANTYMDLNIGIALWLAAGGDGWVYEENTNYNDEDCRCIKYKSKARILLVGSGADEQCAGYGRHRTKYRNGSWLSLNEEMKLDMQRIWKRNLGRDDRCIADHGKEARFPFLDEDVIRILLGFPLWEVTNLDQPSGIGDKKILREVAELLGLHEAASLPKRAIQFGSRIARESNRKNYGSNRAANQASAGSAVIHKRLDMA